VKSFVLRGYQHQVLDLRSRKNDRVRDADPRGPSYQHGLISYPFSEFYSLEAGKELAGRRFQTCFRTDQQSAPAAQGVGALKALFDTNILIDYLNGVVGARAEVEHYERPAISVISWIEGRPVVPRHASKVRTPHRVQARSPAGSALRPVESTQLATICGYVRDVRAPLPGDRANR
jgi:hypothetical protein